MISSFEAPAEGSSSTVNVFDEITHSQHEQVIYCSDNSFGLKCIIGIHSTVLGPALGGTRIWNYASEQEALTDVLRLSRGMTYKAAISGINLGGGKAVIIGDASKLKSEGMWRRYGQFIDRIGGRYITAEDVGTNTKDMEYIAMETDFVAGVPTHLGGGDDPSPFTAYGTFLGMKACAKKVWGNDSLNKRKVCVQGVGHVGQFLINHLIEEGANVYISDIKAEKIKQIANKHKITVVAPEDVYDLDVDIYAPCALGATLNADTIDRLKCSIIAGAANNQLKNEREDGLRVKEKGILYAPDFLINAGGVINCYTEINGYDKERALKLSEKIYDRTLEIIDKAGAENSTTHEAAMQIAKKRIETAALLKSKE